MVHQHEVMQDCKREKFVTSPFNSFGTGTFKKGTTPHLEHHVERMTPVLKTVNSQRPLIRCSACTCENGV
jgi:hypothetical protein